jgi:hypothetical protein
MKCLVCAGEATDRTPRNFDGHVIECPNCGNYEVAGGAWERFRNASKQEWAAKSTVAQRFRQMANNQERLVLIPRSTRSGMRPEAASAMEPCDDPHPR